MDMPGMDHSGHTTPAATPPTPGPGANGTGMGPPSPAMPAPAPMIMQMQMTFYWGPEVTLLFSSWSTQYWGEYLGSLLACLLLALCYEGLATLRGVYAARLRDRAQKQQQQQQGQGQGQLKGLTVGEDAGALEAANGTGPGGSPGPGLGWRALAEERVVSSLLVGVSAAVSYLLMLMLMSFNAGVFIAIVLGHSLGVLVFGGVRRRTEASLFSDSHCGGW